VPQFACESLAGLGEEFSISPAIVQNGVGLDLLNDPYQPWKDNQMPALEDIAEDTVVFGARKLRLLWLIFVHRTG